MSDYGLVQEVHRHTFHLKSSIYREPKISFIEKFRFYQYHSNFGPPILVILTGVSLKVSKRPKMTLTKYLLEVLYALQYDRQYIYYRYHLLPKISRRFAWFLSHVLS